MKVIKNINNNFALATDNDGCMLIIRGKGIGFGSVPRIVDISAVERSYYDIDMECVKIINNIPDQIIEAATIIIDRARKQLVTPIDSGAVFTLADHINFAIQRMRQGINVQLPIAYDIQYFYEKEMEIARYGLEIIEKKTNIRLPEEEANYIALHLINAQQHPGSDMELLDNEIIEEITRIIEKEYEIKINKNNFNYSRFASHMHYLFKRIKTNHLICSDNSAIYKKIKDEYEKTYLCTEKIEKLLKEKKKISLSDEERLYLMLHINRLCSREDYNK